MDFIIDGPLPGREGACSPTGRPERNGSDLEQARAGCFSQEAKHWQYLNIDNMPIMINM
jgi:hypothetical protein